MNHAVHLNLTSLSTLILLAATGTTSGAEVAGESSAAGPGKFSLLGLSAESTMDRTAVGETAHRNRYNATSGEDEPAFTLLGTSRIGSRHSAILRHRDGSEVLVVGTVGEDTPITGYHRFELIAVAPGHVTLQYPDDMPCREFIEQGVDCTDTHTATIGFVAGTQKLRDMLKSRRDGQRQADMAPDRSSSGTTIAPEEVPYGMQVITTADGDRLIPED